MNFLKRNHFAVNALLLSLAFLVGLVVIVILLTLASYGSILIVDDLSVWSYIIVCTVTYFVVMLSMNQLRASNVKFYGLFYLLWLLLLFFSCFFVFIYQEGSDVSLITYTMLFFLMLFLGTPYNIALFVLSFLLLTLYVNNKNDTASKKYFY